ncbi:peptide deformylase [Endozoicomonas sp. OPT23]|uniref:peptide deformylase n=1 Tax=Endozoicomonas sp. OPT23 TaxID=2072845 RepID=UPI00129B4098|nr:peptide deformylase [Endozoicomonas sp. OPT23]MRI33319.1 peptide deformylase [Endozoicomonas sp. OPT23]
MARLPDNPDVLIMGHPLLFKSQRQVTIDEIHSEEFQHNLEVMKQSQFDSIGIGLAAPQIGWEVRVMSIGISKENHARYPKAPYIPFCYWINPQVIEVSKETNWTWEGCLSVPGVRAWIERPAAITLAGYDEHGQRKEESFEGFPARVMQHELDHLNGYLFPMRVDDKSLIIPHEAILHQEQWAENWPTESARNTERGQLSANR